MGAVESPRTQRLWFALFVAGLSAGLALRFYLAHFAQMPGHGDSAFYYTVAKNIASGRGPVVDYIVYFFSGLLPLPHYAGDFWNPSASYLIAIPMFLLGKNISAALVAPILFGILPAVAAYLAGLKYSASSTIGALAGVLTFFSPFQIWFSVTTEAIIFAGAFGSLALYFMMRGSESPPHLLWAALFGGLANLIRQDAIFLLIVLQGCILLSRSARRQKLLLMVAATVIHALVLSPLLIKNFTELHAPFPPGPARIAFLTTYEDFHSFGKEITWKTLRATFGIRGIFARRLHTAGENLGQLEYFIDPVLVTLLLLALADALLFSRKTRPLSLLLPAAAFATSEYLFYSAVVNFSGPGSLIKSLGSLMPFICLLIVDFFGKYLSAKPLLLGVVALLVAYSGFQGFMKNYSSTMYYNGVYEQYKTLKSIVSKDAEHRGMNMAEIVIMARDVWDVHEATEFKTVMVPNNDIATIVAVARHYHARYLLLPARRPQLEKIYNGLTPDARFQYVASVPNSEMKIFWIDFEEQGNCQP